MTARVCSIDSRAASREHSEQKPSVVSFAPLPASWRPVTSLRGRPPTEGGTFTAGRPYQAERMCSIQLAGGGKIAGDVRLFCSVHGERSWWKIRDHADPPAWNSASNGTFHS